MRTLYRADWQALPPKSVSRWQSVRGFTIHWMGGKPWTDTIRLVQSLQRDALHSAKWPYTDIPYNWLVAQDGTIVEGRGWDARSGANYDPFANAHHVAICLLIGPGLHFNEAMQASVAHLIAEGQRRFPTATQIVPHRYWRPTECPGDEAVAWIAARGWEHHAVVLPPTAPPPPKHEDDEMQLLCRAKGTKAAYLINGLHKRGPLTQGEVDFYAFCGVNGRKKNGTVTEVPAWVINRLKAA